MRGDGNGWVLGCECGRRHWGRYGAAGLLVTHEHSVLLQQRAGWTHEGGTWAVPGGARDSHETALQAAIREAGEESSLDTTALVPYGQHADAHDRWSYTTILAHAPGTNAVEPVGAEADAMRWWLIDEVDTLALHQGFAAAWTTLRALIRPTAGLP